jgi:hypothetical protein
MSLPSRLHIGILVTAATLVVCSLGVRAELKTAAHSIARHRTPTPPPPDVARSVAAVREEQSLIPAPR